MAEQTSNGSNTALAPRPTTGISTWNPWKEMEQTRQRMEALFGPVFGFPAFPRFAPTELMDKEPEVDIHETDEAYQVLASLPGYTQDQIQIEATDTTLCVSGERQALVEKDKAKTHRNNGVSNSSSFTLAYTLPSEIDPKKIEATFANGVLQLNLPKTEQARSKSVKVAIKP